MVTTVSLVHCVFYEQVRLISHCTGNISIPIVLGIFLFPVQWELEIVHVKQTHFSSNY